MRTLLLLSAVGVVVLGCNSFNRINQRDYESGHTHTHETVASTPPTLVNRQDFNKLPEPEAPIKKPDGKLCPVYKLPPLPKMPELPYRELGQISPSDHVALDQLERKHLEDLRLYISKLKQTIIRSHQTYLVSCDAVGKLPKQK